MISDTLEGCFNEIFLLKKLVELLARLRVIAISNGLIWLALVR